jgi:hypothetical protein
MIITFPVSSVDVDRWIQVKDSHPSAHQNEFIGIDLNYPGDVSPADELKD